MAFESSDIAAMTKRLKALSQAEQERRQERRTGRKSKAPLIAKSFNKMRPIVMFKGCESALPGTSLTSRDSYPHRFMRLEAAAFVGALWPVESRGAAIFAGESYKELAATELRPVFLTTRTKANLLTRSMAT